MPLHEVLEGVLVIPVSSYDATKVRNVFPASGYQQNEHSAAFIVVGDQPVAMQKIEKSLIKPVWVFNFPNVAQKHQMI